MQNCLACTLNIELWKGIGKSKNPNHIFGQIGDKTSGKLIDENKYKEH